MITTGSIVKVRFPYIEKLDNLKTRYGLIISDEGYHQLFRKRRYIVAYISSSIPSQIIPEWEFVIEEGSELFNQAGLVRTSLVKAHRILVVQEEEVIKVVGHVPISFVKEVRKVIPKMFGLHS